MANTTVYQAINPNTLLKYGYEDPWYALGLAVGNAGASAYMDNYNNRGIRKAADAGIAEINDMASRIGKPQAPIDLEVANRTLDRLNNMGSVQDYINNRPIPQGKVISSGIGQPLTVKEAPTPEQYQAMVAERQQAMPQAGDIKVYSSETMKTPVDLNWSKADYVNQWIAKERANGRSEYQINEALKLLQPSLDSMQRKVNDAQDEHFLNILMPKAGPVDMQDPNNMKAFIQWAGRNPTSASLFMKQMKDVDNQRYRDQKLANSQAIASIRANSRSSSGSNSGGGGGKGSNAHWTKDPDYTYHKAKWEKFAEDSDRMRDFIGDDGTITFPDDATPEEIEAVRSGLIANQWEVKNKGTGLSWKYAKDEEEQQ